MTTKFDESKLRELETAFSFSYPIKYIQLAKDFESHRKNFDTVFKSYMFVDDLYLDWTILNLDRLEISDLFTTHDFFKATGLIPFLIDFLHQDIICFEKNNSGDPTVCAFSIHTQVYTWKNFDDFLRWVDVKASGEAPIS